MITTWPRVLVFSVPCAWFAARGSVLGAAVMCVIAAANVVWFYSGMWWICPRCGAHQWRRFGWAHRPASNPGIRTCGGNPVHFWRVKRARQREIDAARRVALMLMARESGRWRG